MRRAINPLRPLPTAAVVWAREIALADIPGSNQVGGAIPLLLAPDIADPEADTEEEGVNEARERLRGSTELFRAGRGGGGAGAEAEQEGDGGVMAWGAREGVIIGWGWRVNERKCASRELRRGGRKMRQVHTWTGQKQSIAAR